MFSNVPYLLLTKDASNLIVEQMFIAPSDKLLDPFVSDWANTPSNISVFPIGDFSATRLMKPVMLGPNIRGALKQNYVGDGSDCIIKTASNGGVAHYDSNGSCYELNASIASAVYSRSDTIQPNSGYVLMIIKE